MEDKLMEFFSAFAIIALIWIPLITIAAIKDERQYKAAITAERRRMIKDLTEGMSGEQRLLLADQTIHFLED